MKKTTLKQSMAARGKILKGVVASNKMKDTAVVVIERFVKHPRYGKYVKHRKRIKAHDAGNTQAVGDKVSIREVKPISKGKMFVVIQETK